MTRKELIYENLGGLEVIIKEWDRNYGEHTWQHCRSEIELMMKEYALYIVDKCAENFEYTMEINYVPGAENEYQSHPVLTRGSKVIVKKMIDEDSE